MTHPDLLILSACSEELAIWAEANTSNVEITSLGAILIGQDTGLKHALES